MWRSKTGRADIANYVLAKLGNYGRAIGLLD
jgi:DNA (cytosine-5)-methyltransferase 1